MTRGQARPDEMRALLLADFLAKSGWDDAEGEPFAADFSPRRYVRLTKPTGECAILMDADANQKTPQFVRIDRYLHDLGLSVPTLLAENAAHGLVLMEDFGTRQVGALLDAGENRTPYDSAAIDCLVQLHQRALPPAFDVPLFDARLFRDQVMMFIDHYLPLMRGTPATNMERDDFMAAWEVVLRAADRVPRSFMLRDFMPDNLMDLPGRTGAARLGILDFQDGGWGPVAYDIASLAEVVRRDTGNEVLEQLARLYMDRAQPAVEWPHFLAACQTLSLQRHMRILGLLAKRAAEGHDDKSAFIPRVRAWVIDLLQKQGLAPIKVWMDECVLRHGI